MACFRVSGQMRPSPPRSTAVRQAHRTSNECYIARKCKAAELLCSAASCSLHRAKCVAVIPHMVKGGFIFGAKDGKGAPTSDTSLSKVSTMLRAMAANGSCSY